MSVKEFGSDRRDGLANESGGGRQEQFPSSTSFNLGCYQKVPPRFRVGLPASNNVI